MSRRLSGRHYRRLVSAVLGAALGGGMLGAVPAEAARSGSLVQIVSPASGAVIDAATVPVTIQLLPGARPPTLQVMLDFRDVTARFHRHGHTAQAVLGTKDGLVTGNNVITASVTGPARARSTAQVIFQANTGVVTGPAPTPATFSLQTRVSRGNVLLFPENFEVVVGNVTHTPPGLPPGTVCSGGGEPGVWVLALNRQSLDQLSSEVLPLCTDEQTAALGTYLAGLPTTDMVIVNSISIGGGQPAIKGLGDALSKIGAVKAEFNPIGAAGDGDLAYSVEGIPGLPPGQAYQVIGNLSDETSVPAGSPTAASINATLVPDNHGNYTLDMRDYVPFSISGGTDFSAGEITVGGHTYPPDHEIVNLLLQELAAGNVVGGFHVLVLDRRTLQVVSDRTYVTADGTLGAGADISNDLTTVAHNFGESGLVLVASIGNPMADGQQQGIAAPTIAQALAPFGGTPDVINSGANHPGNNTWPYALVGAVSPPAAYGLRRIDAPEASPVIRAGETGQLQGVLRRGTRGMWYSPASWNAPVVLDVNGVKQPPTTSNYGLFSAIAQPATPWPVPVPSGPDHDGQLAAYQYLSQQACNGCNQDIRAFYGAQEETIQTWQAVIKATTYPSNPAPPFTQDQFTAVKNELVGDPTDPRSLGELGDVVLIDGLRDSMHTLLSDSNQMAQPTLTAAYNDVKATLAPPPSTVVGSAVYDIIELLQAVADIGSVAELEVPGVSEVLGLVAALVEGANDLNTDPNGALEDQLDTTVTNLGQQAADSFAASLTGLDETFATIFSDYGRLSVVADGLQNHPASWDTSGKEGTLVTAMTNAMKIGYYRTLIPLIYSALEGPAQASPDPARFCGPACPFDPHYVDNHQPYLPGIAAYAYPINDPANGFAAGYHLIVVGKGGVVYEGGSPTLLRSTDPFPPAMMSDLTSAGYYPGWFFQRFPLTRFICKPGQQLLFCGT